MRNLLKGLFMIIFVVFIPLILTFIFTVISKDLGFIIGVFSFLYLILISIQYLKFGFFNPLKLFEINTQNNKGIR